MDPFILATLLVLAFGLGIWLTALAHCDADDATLGALVFTGLLLLVVWAVKGLMVAGAFS